MFKTTKVIPKIVYRSKYRMIYTHTQILFLNPLELLGINILNQDSKHIFKIDIQ